MTIPNNIDYTIKNHLLTIKISVNDDFLNEIKLNKNNYIKIKNKKYQYKSKYVVIDENEPFYLINYYDINTN